MRDGNGDDDGLGVRHWKRNAKRVHVRHCNAHSICNCVGHAHGERLCNGERHGLRKQHANGDCIQQWKFIWVRHWKRDAKLVTLRHGHVHLVRLGVLNFNGKRLRNGERHGLLERHGNVNCIQQWKFIWVRHW